MVCGSAVARACALPSLRLAECAVWGKTQGDALSLPREAHVGQALQYEGGA